MYRVRSKWMSSVKRTRCAVGKSAAIVPSSRRHRCALGRWEGSYPPWTVHLPDKGRHQRLSACIQAGRTLLKGAIRGYQHEIWRVGP